MILYGSKSLQAHGLISRDTDYDFIGSKKSFYDFVAHINLPVENYVETANSFYAWVYGTKIDYDAFQTPGRLQLIAMTDNEPRKFLGFDVQLASVTSQWMILEAVYGTSLWKDKYQEELDICRNQNLTPTNEHLKLQALYRQDLLNAN